MPAFTKTVEARFADALTISVNDLAATVTLTLPDQP